MHLLFFPLCCCFFLCHWVFSCPFLHRCNTKLWWRSSSLAIQILLDSLRKEAHPVFSMDVLAARRDLLQLHMWHFPITGFYSPLLINISIPFSTEGVFLVEWCKHIHMNLCAIGSAYLLSPYSTHMGFMKVYTTYIFNLLGSGHWWKPLIDDNKYMFDNMATRCMVHMVSNGEFCFCACVL
jgi:hypothetical protein